MNIAKTEQDEFIYKLLHPNKKQIKYQSDLFVYCMLVAGGKMKENESLLKRMLEEDLK